MIATEDLRPAYSSAVADRSDVPLSEMLALGTDVLWGTIGRVLPDPSAGAVPVAAFQSSI